MHASEVGQAQAGHPPLRRNFQDAAEGAAEGGVADIAPGAPECSLIFAKRDRSLKIGCWGRAVNRSAGVFAADRTLYTGN